MSASLFTFLLIFSACVYFSYNEVREGVSKTVTSKLECAVRALDEGLSSTLVSSANLVSVLKSPLIKEIDESIYESCKYFLDANTMIQGVCLGFEPNVVEGHPEGFAPYVMRSNEGFEPNVVEGHPEGFAPYVMRSNEGFVCRDLAQEKDYRASDWYCTPFNKWEPTWSRPFRESNGTIITSYNVPLEDSEGRHIGIAAVDLNLNVVSDSLQLQNPYPNSSLSIIDSTGMYVAHRDRSYILEKSVSPELLASLSNPDQHLYIDKGGVEDIYVFHMKEPKTGWTILLSVPKTDMGQSTTKMLKILLINILIGILLLLNVSLLVISRLTKPLEKFSKAAREIAKGNFDVELPEINDKNELHDLREALSSMGTSIKDYTKELEESSSRKASIEKELTIARSIQMAMLPKTFPPFPHIEGCVDLYASLTPAQAVGGDLYDFQLCGDNLFYCIGDVSGKGVPASLLMAITRSLFRNSAQEDKTPAQIARLINDSIAENNEMSMFVTMFIVRYNIRTGELSICNCGHNPPATNGIIVDEATMLTAPSDRFHYMQYVPTNIAVGVFPGFEFKEVHMTVTPGITMMLYTDGITEAENMKQEQYGEPRFLEVLDANIGSSSRQILETVIDDVRKFTDGAPQSDDITALCLRCNKIMGNE